MRKKFFSMLVLLAAVATGAMAQTETLLTTITATAKEQASYSTANVATVSFSYTAGGSSAYSANWGWWGCGWSATVTAAEGYTITKCIFYDDANRTATDNEAPFVVETTEEDKTPRINGTSIDGGNNQSKGLKKIEVYGYATPVSGVTLSQDDAVLTVGAETLTLTATVAPANAKDKTVTWTTSNDAVATVDANGVVTAVSAGTATITATATNGTDDTSDDKTATCTVTQNYKITLADGTEDSGNWTISPANPQPGDVVTITYGGTKKVKSVKAVEKAAVIKVTIITLNKTETTINVGSTETLSVTAIDPSNATDKTYTWNSDNTAVATVDADGVVTAKAAGTANITATANDGSGVTATCAVTVIVPVSSITINNAPTEALFVNSTGTLTATVLPNDATDKTVTWSSDNPNHVKIDAATGEYTVTGVDGYGSATITATANDGSGVIATCTITGKVTYTSLSAGTVIHVGDTFYTGGSVAFQTTPGMSFNASNGVITLVEATSGSSKYYKFQRGSNGTMPNVTAYKVKDNTDGVYITGGSGTSQDKFTLAVHTIQ